MEVTLSNLLEEGEWISEPFLPLQSGERSSWLSIRLHIEL